MRPDHILTPDDLQKSRKPRRNAVIKGSMFHPRIYIMWKPGCCKRCVWGIHEYAMWLRERVRISKPCTTIRILSWAERRATDPRIRVSLSGFGVGLPLSEIHDRFFPFVFTSINDLMMYTPLKYIAPKLIYVIDVE